MKINANEKFEAAKVAANLNDSETMRDLFNAAATKYYLDHTEKTFEELKNFDSSEWANGCTGTEWLSIESCIDCAEEAATQLLEEE